MKLRKIITGWISVFLVITLVSISAKEYSDDYFDKNETDVRQTCTGTLTSDDDKEMCNAYYQYVQNKAAKAKEDAANLQAQISNNQVQIDQYEAQINTLNEQITAYQANIDDLNGQIDTLNASIADTQAAITAKEAEIAQTREKIKRRMVVMQSYSDTNMIFEFISGSQSFSELLSRIDGVNDITTYDKELVKSFETQKEELAASQAEEERQKAAVEESKRVVEGYQATLQSTVDSISVMRNALMATKASLAEQLDILKVNQAELSDLLNNINLSNIVASSGLIMPFSTGSISAGTWQYPDTNGMPNGGVHTGVDFTSSNSNQQVLAIANGYVIASRNSCPDYPIRSFSNPCGAGGGNYLYELIELNGSIYVIGYFHMKANTVRAAGQAIAQGQGVGVMGQSGYTFGAHLHMEVLYVGSGTMQDWDGSYGIYGYANRCEVRGYQAPCQMRPELLYNSQIYPGLRW